jgi:asparagine N-glycosylation enzyme membrane subunit Stt3
MDEHRLLKERANKILSLAKTKTAILTYIFLALIVLLSIYIRTINVSQLTDVTTGEWTLGPDLDPFLFLRWAKVIVAEGSLFSVDSLRYVPVGFNVKEELILHPYTIALFHKVAVLFGSTSVTQSAAIFPVFMFALTVIAFFLLTRKIFLDSQGEVKSNIIALISSLFLTIIPVILPRTIAGIPEKESAGFFYLFIALYFFLCAWKSKSTKGELIFATLAAIATAMMSAIWGGYIFILLSISLTVFFALILGQVTKRRAITFATWLIVSYLIMGLLSTRYSLHNLLDSTTTAIPMFILLLLIVDFVIWNTKLSKYFENYSSKIPKSIISVIVGIIVALIAALILIGPSTVVSQFGDLTQVLIEPQTDRLGVTVAENKQPYFQEWAYSFGPLLGSIPIFFWIFIIGSIYLFYHLVRRFSKIERTWIVSSYVFFLFAIIFSRYSATSLFNGVNFASLALYFIGVLVLVGTFGYYLFKATKENSHDKYTNIDAGLLLLFAFFFLSIISARGAVRLIMVLVPTGSILASYFAVSMVSSSFGKNSKDDLMKTLSIIFTIILVVAMIFSAYYFYNGSIQTAKSEVPSQYTVQWQKAMSWVRESTPKTAVFAHWWDYGYWVQSIGERATIVDGGNAIPYWNYLMGRNVLTGYDDKNAIEFLYAHKATHLLIDSSDIGKYPAFSSIGSDQTNDRYSWLPSLVKDEKQSQETKNSTIEVYAGGTYIDQDIIYTYNGTKVQLAAQKGVFLGVIVERNINGIVSQPRAVFVPSSASSTRYDLPLRYAYYDGKLTDYGSGLNSGIFIIPKIEQTSTGGISIDPSGAAIYLTNKTIDSRLVRLYLFNENNQYFKLAHTEDDYVVEILKQQNATNSDFVHFGEVRGPIKIWSISYPTNVPLNQTYLLTDYPDKSLK